LLAVTFLEETEGEECFLPTKKQLTFHASVTGFMGKGKVVPVINQLSTTP
jgi:hypothetical protein